MLSRGRVHLSATPRREVSNRQARGGTRIALTRTGKEIVIHSAHESLLILVRRYNGDLLGRVEALLGLVLESLGERVAACSGDERRV